MRGVDERLLLPFVILNVLLIPISAIWLAFQDEWWALAGGLVWGIASSLLLGSLMTPGLVIEESALIYLEKGQRLRSTVLLMVEQFYVYALMSVSCLIMFALLAGDATDSSFWPLSLWAYAMAFCPYLAHQDRYLPSRAGVTWMTLFSALAYGVMVSLTAFSGLSFLEVMIAFLALMMAGAVGQTGCTMTLHRAVIETDQDRRSAA